MPPGQIRSETGRGTAALRRITENGCPAGSTITCRSALSAPRSGTTGDADSRVARRRNGFRRSNRFGGAVVRVEKPSRFCCRRSTDFYRFFYRIYRNGRSRTSTACHGLRTKLQVDGTIRGRLTQSDRRNVGLITRRSQVQILPPPPFAPLDDTGAQLLFRFVAAAYERSPLASPVTGRLISGDGSCQSTPPRSRSWIASCTTAWSWSPRASRFACAKPAREEAPQAQEALIDP